MWHDYIVLNAGRELRAFEEFASYSPEGKALVIPMLKYLTELAIDLDNRRERLLYLIASLQGMVPEHTQHRVLSNTQKLVGDLAMNLFNSVDDLLGTHLLLPAPGSRHLLSDYKYHGLCEQGVILARPVIAPQSF